MLIQKRVDARDGQYRRLRSSVGAWIEQPLGDHPVVGRIERRLRNLRAELCAFAAAACAAATAALVFCALTTLLRRPICAVL